VSGAIMLDSGPLGRLANPTPAQATIEWRDRVIAAGFTFMIPEIADYEVRRNLICERKLSSLATLDHLKTIFTYQPITTTAMLKAAELWADARRRGRSTADPKELDGDVILAAQALESGAIVATENVGSSGPICAGQALVADHLRSEAPKKSKGPIVSARSFDSDGVPPSLRMKCSRQKTRCINGTAE
jgi:predicted nucleic acid-binding protein